MDKDSLQGLLEQGVSVERIAKRFGKDPSTVSYWMKKYGLASPFKEKHAAKGGIDRDQLEALVEAGMTIAEIAEFVGRSSGTVRHWLRRCGLRTRRARRDGVTWQADKAQGRAQIMMECRRHGVAEFVLEGRGYYRCKRCRAESVVRHRQKLKATLVAEAGGQCSHCGYDRNLGALQFHHLDPEQKRLALSGHGMTYSLEVLRQEARKCILLCANCHAEVEHRTGEIPLKSAA